MRFLYVIVTIGIVTLSSAQSIKTLELSTDQGVAVRGYVARDDTRIACTTLLPLFSFELNDTVLSAFSVKAGRSGDTLFWTHGSDINGSLRIEKEFGRGWKALLVFRNSSNRKQQISDVVPFGVGSDRVYIISAGPSDFVHRLTRSQLFRPGAGPIGVVLPDNAWEMGFCDICVAPSKSLTAIARRTGSGKADERRFRTILEPGGFVQYTLFVDEHAGDWHEGLRMMFQKRWLYDLETFDNTLYVRKDLEWIRHSYLLLLQFAWDEEYYDALEGRYVFDRFIAEQDNVLGGYDAFMIWPTWPRLGLDQRNQWDMYRDLPGGLDELRRQANAMHQRGGRYFISYNPWDESTAP